ncbi:hypothetical protein F4779DRAFT_613083 [Xylariaceae sp. FL0662B]|nr:hypothetical protein F4779DRAFT_613083 [Xylariaceae sp. FL0662B]
MSASALLKREKPGHDLSSVLDDFFWITSNYIAADGITRLSTLSIEAVYVWVGASMGQRLALSLLTITLGLFSGSLTVSKPNLLTRDHRQGERAGDDADAEFDDAPANDIAAGTCRHGLRPTENIEQVKRDVKEFGYGLVRNAPTGSQVRILGDTLRHQTAGAIQRVSTLVNKGDEFLDQLNHSLIDVVVRAIAPGRAALIQSYSTRPTSPSSPPLRDLGFGLDIMWYVTERNGGMRVFPRGHVSAVAPADLFTAEGTVTAQGPAGTALVFESRLWHATGRIGRTPANAR